MIACPEKMNWIVWAAVASAENARVSPETAIRAAPRAVARAANVTTAFATPARNSGFSRTKRSIASAYETNAARFFSKYEIRELVAVALI